MFKHVFVSFNATHPWNAHESDVKDINCIGGGLIIIESPISYKIANKNYSEVPHICNTHFTIQKYVNVR